MGNRIAGRTVPHMKQVKARATNRVLRDVPGLIDLPTLSRSNAAALESLAADALHRCVDELRRAKETWASQGNDPRHYAARSVAYWTKREAAARTARDLFHVCRMSWQGIANVDAAAMTAEAAFQQEGAVQ